MLTSSPRLVSALSARRWRQRRRDPRPRPGAGARGTVKRKTYFPCRARFPRQIRPPCASTIPFDRGPRPRPIARHRAGLALISVLAGNGRKIAVPSHGCRGLYRRPSSGNGHLDLRLALNGAVTVTVPASGRVLHRVLTRRFAEHLPEGVGRPRGHRGQRGRSHRTERPASSRPAISSPHDAAIRFDSQRCRMRSAPPSIRERCESECSRRSFEDGRASSSIAPSFAEDLRLASKLVEGNRPTCLQQS
jgi:hypothetical protein